MGGQKVTASQRGDSWHKTGETGKLPEEEILGKGAKTRELHVRDSAVR
jgi:hypothetical protein